MQKISDMKAEMEKLNAAQRSALRRKFGGRTATYIFFNEVMGLLTVQFGGKVQHQMFMGPRGAIRCETTTVV